jgi:hypothetical protein
MDYVMIDFTLPRPDELLTIEPLLPYIMMFLSSGKVSYQGTVGLACWGPAHWRHILFWPYVSLCYDRLRRAEQHEGRASTLQHDYHHESTVDT